MDYWGILGIEPTEDLNVIKGAYASRLKHNHPEEQPEGFKELRAAYEQARKMASTVKDQPMKNDFDDDRTDRFTEDKQDLAQGIHIEDLHIAPPKWEDPLREVVNHFLEEVIRLYEDFNLRIRYDLWVNLVEDEQFWGIQVRERLHTELLVVLSERSWLPGFVWKLLDDTFGWMDNELELSERFSSSFLSHIRYQNQSLYDLQLEFLHQAAADGLEIDNYLYIREFARRALIHQDLDTAHEMLGKAYELYEQDPVLLRLIAVYSMNVEDWETALHMYSRLAVILPNEPLILRNLADMLLKCGHTNEALSINMQLSDATEPAIYCPALSSAAQCLILLGRKNEVIALYKAALERFPADLELRTRLWHVRNEYEQERITILEEELQNNSYPRTEHIEELIELYRISKQSDKVLSLIEGFGSEVLLSSNAWFSAAQIAYDVDRKLALQYLNHSVAKAADEAFVHQEALYLRTKVNYNLDHYEAVISDGLILKEYMAEEPGVYFYLGESYRMLEEYEQAIENLLQAQTLKGGEGYEFGLAFSYYHLEQYDKAITCFETHLNEGNERADLYYYLGISYMKLDRFEDAAQCFQASLRIESYPSTLYHLFTAYRRQCEFDLALTVIDQYLETGDNSYRGEALGAAADIHFYRKHWSMAYDFLLTFYHDIPESLYLQKMIAVCLLADRKFEEAAKWILMIQNHEPNNPWALLQMIRIFAELKQWDELDSAMVHYYKTVEPAKIDGYSYFYGGLHLYQARKYDVARKMLTRAYEFGLRGDTCSLLSLSYMHLGQGESALVYAKEAVAERPNHPDYLARLQDLEERLSQRGAWFNKLKFNIFQTGLKQTVPLQFPDLLNDEELRPYYNVEVFNDAFFA
ncbi:tetratricopeptide repeat protein [Paenibacillus xylanexedens]|uniref:tetratricopeptide repeat protein n=1 Tax=Paenibacillus xylanexedens TaxID=528191 RepID=UPI0011A59F08|nr:tetratricopeptide repeat protein [Paenibacillus xylanexedens]